jgi:hypothetical protein
MNRMSKALGLSALALGLFGVLASTASAEVVQRITSSSPNNKTILTITQDGTEGTTTAHFVLRLAFQITCNGLHGEMTFEGAEIQDLTFVPSFTACKILGFGIPFKAGGCAFTVQGAGSLQIVNAAGKNCATEPMNLQLNGCQLKIAAQSSIGGHITFHNENTTPMTITGEVENNSTHPSSIQYTQTGVACPESGKQLSNGTLETGNITITGFEDVAGPKEGSQVDVTVS